MNNFVSPSPGGFAAQRHAQRSAQDAQRAPGTGPGQEGEGIPRDAAHHARGAATGTTFIFLIKTMNKKSRILSYYFVIKNKDLVNICE